MNLLIGLLAAQTVMFHTARWSPDGDQLLIARQLENSVQGYVFDVRRGQLRTIQKSALDALESSWQQPSHDPEVIEQRTANGQAVVLRKRGGAARQISQEPWAEQPSVSPDGEWIVYEARDNPHDVLASWVVIVDTNGSRRRRLYRGTDPSWSPDGERILFKTPRAGVLHVATIRSSGGAATLLTPGVHPAWSPDGKRIAYMSESGQRSDIWIMAADGSAKVCVTCVVR